MLIQEEYFKNIFNTVREAILILDEDMRVLSANRSFFKIFKVDSASTIGSLLYDLGNGQWNIPYLRVLLEDVLPQNDSVDDYEIEHNFESIGPKTMLLNACKIREKNNDQPIILLVIEDITEHKRLENLLADSEERYRRLFETASDGIVLLEKKEGKITHTNPAAEKMLGYPKEECTGKKLQDIGVSLDTSDFSGIMQDLDNYGILNYADVPIKTKSGQSLNADIYMVDRAKLAQCNIRDVSERKRAEEELRESQQILEGIINAIPARVFWKDKNLIYLGCNAAFARDAGFNDPKEVIGKDDYQMGWCDQAELYRSDDRQVVDNGITKFLIEEPQTLGGNTITLLTSKLPLRNSEGEISGVLGTYIDITERKKTEEALRESSEFNRQIIESAQEGIIVYGLDMKFQSWNPFMERLTGLSADEVLGGHPLEVFPFLRETGVMACIDKALAGEVCEVNRFQYHVPATGRSGWASEICSPLNNAKGAIIGVIGTVRDITEHVRTEDQLRHAQKMEAVGTLAGGIAHDFNNILNVIIGYGSMALDRLGDDHVSREQMNEVLAAADRAANLTKRLLAFSRRQVVDMKPVNINEIIAGMEKMVSRIIGEDIAFTMKLTGSGTLVMADSGQMEQVLMNLVSNAHDAMPMGGRLMISTEIMEVDDAYIAAYGYGKTGMYTFISVTDTGSGMDAETQKKIFEPFFTTKGIGEGTGLGLAIAYGIIRQHDGYIKVYSEEGTGTTFKILLPLIEEKKAKRQEVKAPVQIKGGTETILVAEDDATLRKLSRIVLESFGYSVITAEDGEEAVTRYKEHKEKIQLVILDMLMPKKSGKEAYEKIRELSPDVRALFATGYTMDILTKKELLGENMEFITKPVTPKDLLKRVREVLDK
jgi:PAS domain S-box-containing protein